MIGFNQAKKIPRRPLYSLSGAKLCYFTSSPKGDTFYDLRGRKIANPAKYKKMLSAANATTNASGTVFITVQEIDENC